MHARLDTTLAAICVGGLSSFGPNASRIYTLLIIRKGVRFAQSWSVACSDTMDHPHQRPEGVRVCRPGSGTWQFWDRLPIGAPTSKLVVTTQTMANISVWDDMVVELYLMSFSDQVIVINPRQIA